MPAKSKASARPSTNTVSEVEQEGPDPTEGHSSRYTYFYRALQLAAQKLSTKWTDDDFAQCFPTWAKESPQGVAQVRVQIGEHIRDQIIEQTLPILESYRAADGIDTLAEVIQDAKARLAEGRTNGGDVWREGLSPQILVGARTSRVMKGEKERLEEMLKELEEENLSLYASFREKTAARTELTTQLESYLTDLEKAVEQVNGLSIDEASEWMETAVDPVPVEGN